MWKDKLNKKQEGYYQILDEEVILESGSYDGELAHDNIVKGSIHIFTDKGFKGREITTFFTSYSPETPWKISIRILADVDKVYVSYQTKGDTVEAEDINKLQRYKADQSVIDNIEKELERLEDIKVDLSKVEELIDDIPEVFHNAPMNAVTEDMIPSDFDYGVTICNQGQVGGFPTINEYGVSITIRGVHASYAQIFITRFGDMWSRRSGVINEWNGEWYNSKKEIDKKADKDKVVTSVNGKVGDVIIEDVGGGSGSATVVIASGDSYDSDSADIIIRHSEDTGKILTETVEKLSNTGGLIQFLEGTYYFDSKGIIQTDNITINGIYKATKFIARNLDEDSRGAIIEVGEDGSGDIENQVDGFKISNIVIKGTDKGKYRGIALWGATNSVIEYVESYNNSGIGVQLSSNSSATISNVKSYGNSSGIATFGDSKATITNVESYNNSGIGVQLSSNSSATISNVKSYGNSSGIATFGDSKATITNVESYNNESNGIATLNDSKATISNVKIWGNESNGIATSDDSKATIFNVEIYENSANGIYLSSNSSAIVSNVKSYNNEANGIQISNNASVLIQLSKIYNNNKNDKFSNDCRINTSNQIIALNNYVGITNNSSRNGFSISSSVSNAVIAHNIIVDDYSGSMINDDGKNTITELSGNVGV